MDDLSHPLRKLKYTIANGVVRVPCLSCNADTAKASGAECYNCRNKSMSEDPEPVAHEPWCKGGNCDCLAYREGTDHSLKRAGGYCCEMHERRPCRMGVHKETPSTLAQYEAGESNARQRHRFWAEWAARVGAMHGIQEPDIAGQLEQLIAALKAQLAAVEANLHKVNADYIELRAAGEGPSTHAMNLAAEFAQATAERDAAEELLKQEQHMRVLTESDLAAARAEIEVVAKTWRAAEADLMNARAEVERLTGTPSGSPVDVEEIMRNEKPAAKTITTCLPGCKRRRPASECDCREKAARGQAEAHATVIAAAEDLLCGQPWMEEYQQHEVLVRINALSAELSSARAALGEAAEDLKAANLRGDKFKEWRENADAAADRLADKLSSTHAARVKAEAALAEVTAERACASGSAHHAFVKCNEPWCAKCGAQAPIGAKNVCPECYHAKPCACKIQVSAEDALADARLVLGALGVRIIDTNDEDAGYEKRITASRVTDSPDAIAAWRRLMEP